MLTIYDPSDLTNLIGLACRRSMRPVDKLNVLHRTDFMPNVFDHVIFWHQEPHILEGTPSWREEFYDQEPDHFIFAHKEPISTKSRAFCPVHLLFTVRANLKNFPAIKNPSSKPFIADVLLGQPKPHRWIIFNMLKEYNLLDSCLANLAKGTYTDTRFESSANKQYPWGDVVYYKSEPLLRLEEEPVARYKMMIPNNFFDSGQIVAGKTGKISQMIPHKIYDNSYISIVCETWYFNDVFFPTEKIGKCLLAGRLFLVASSRYFLKNLREMGFETFSDVIDESYDELKDDESRFYKMMESFKELAKQDLVKVHQKILPKLRHNQSLMTKEYLGKEAREFIKQIAG